MDRSITYGSRYCGRTLLMVQVIKYHLVNGTPIVIATGNQLGTIDRLREYFPTAFFELVEDWGVKVHERKLK